MIEYNKAIANLICKVGNYPTMDCLRFTQIIQLAASKESYNGDLFYCPDQTLYNGLVKLDKELTDS